MDYKSMLTPEHVRSYIEVLKREKEFSMQKIQNFLNLTRKLEIRMSDGMPQESPREDGTFLRDVGYRVVVSIKEAGEFSFGLYNLRSLSPESEGVSDSGLDTELPRPGLRDILQHIGFILHYGPMEFGDPAKRRDYPDVAEVIDWMQEWFSESDRVCLPSSSRSDWQNSVNL